MDDSDLIDAMGGTSAVARLCDVKLPSVSEWRKNGIPRARRMYLAQLRPDLFGKQAKSNKRYASNDTSKAAA